MAEFGEGARIVIASGALAFSIFSLVFSIAINRRNAQSRTKGGMDGKTN